MIKRFGNPSIEIDDEVSEIQYIGASGCCSNTLAKLSMKKLKMWWNSNTGKNKKFENLQTFVGVTF